MNKKIKNAIKTMNILAWGNPDMKKDCDLAVEALKDYQPLVRANDLIGKLESLKVFLEYEWQDEIIDEAIKHLEKTVPEKNWIGKVAYSQYFNCFITVTKYVSDNHWYFTLCTKDGLPINKTTAKARANINEFQWG